MSDPTTATVAEITEKDHTGSARKVSRHTALREHGNGFKALAGPPNSPDRNPVEHLWHVLGKQVWYNLQDLKDLLLMVLDTIAYFERSSGVHASTY